MPVKFAVYVTDKTGKATELLFTSELPVNYDPEQSGPRVTLDDLHLFCDNVNNDGNVVPRFRLELQRIALLAEPEVIQYLAAKVGE